MFRLENKKTAYARLYCSSVGVFDIYINGQRVGVTESGKTVYDEMKPGWTDYDKRLFYNTYDITPYLENGENGVGVLLAPGWAMGSIVHGWTDRRTYSFNKIAFVARLDVVYADGSVQTVVTDGTWSGSYECAVKYSDIYNGETYDANLPGGEKISLAGFDAAAWKPVELTDEFRGEITAFIGQTVRVRKGLTRKPVSVTVYEKTKDNGTDYGEIVISETYDSADNIVIKKGSTAIFDLAQNMVGFPVISVTADKGTDITLRVAEMLNDSGSESRGNDGAKGSLYTRNYRSAKATGHYIACGNGKETYRPLLTFYGFRYVSITADSDITLNALSCEVLGSDLEETGRITTDNESVNKLISNIMWGQRGNYLSVPTDCPQRDERLGWTGDTQIFCSAAAYNADIDAFMHKWLQDARDSQTGGEYTDVIPRVNYVGSGAAAWGDAGIIVPYTVYKMYGDTAVIDEMYDSMEEYMTWLEKKRKYKGAKTSYGDWLSYEGNDGEILNVVACAYYAYDCILMEKMCRATGRTQRAEHFAARYVETKKYFGRKFLTGKNDLKRKCSTQTCYLLALKTDMFPDEQAKQAAVKILAKKIQDNGNRLSTGFVGTGTLNQTLSAVGESRLAYTLLLQRDNPSWLYSVDQGATTIWERWNSYTIKDGFGDAGMNSFNHYAYGVIGEWMYADMLGIKADDGRPGFKHIILCPTPDDRQEKKIPANQKRIASVSGKLSSVYGDIEAQWQYGNGFRFTAKTPANTKCTVYLPVPSIDGVTVNGKSADSLKAETDGIKFSRTENGRAVFEAANGSFEFICKISTLE
ncbi:MAG: glycoside hydrolase family 78 protein [Clostridia bacterium]|nr:glycoside hydrolase family 78 protein [Clostridia bacterium]